MKSLKTKLVASVVMLAVAAVMLTSASFAWYTVSTEGNVAKVKVQIQAIDNLEIAVASAQPGEVALGDSETLGQQAWGSNATYDENGVLLQIPATLTGTALQTCQYDEDGRLMQNLVDCTEITAATYTTNGATPATMGYDGKVAAAVYDFYVRTNSATPFQIGWTNPTGQKLKISLSDGTSVVKTWNGSYGDTLTVTPTLTNGYFTKHYIATIYIEGTAVTAKDIDTAEALLPAFAGTLSVHR